ncbi:hypothetical protein D3C86_1763320 [compost metagenome]
MNVQGFLIGAAFLVASFLIYYWIKGVKSSSEDPDGNGPTQANLLGLWVSVFMCGIVGIVYVIKSFYP